MAFNRGFGDRQRTEYRCSASVPGLTFFKCPPDHQAKTVAFNQFGHPKF